MHLYNKILFVVCFSNTLTILLGFRLEVLKHCCDLGTNYANNDLKCSSFQTPIAGVQTDEEPYCLDSIAACCKKQLKESECKAGLEDARNGICDPNAATERKSCCDACNLGTRSGSSGQACDGIGLPHDKHFISCCNEASSKTTQATPGSKSTIASKVTTVSKNDPLPSIENLCDIGDLCAQICIPTADSYKCDCNPGYALMADGISCKEIKQKPTTLRRTNKCEVNNPCEHNCVDTGVAIQCSCKEGYQLAKDKRSCKDIDECALGIHSCLANEICINGDGYYDCEMIDDDDEDLDDEIADYDKNCPVGYKFNGELRVCDDINECQIPLVCEHGKTCTNTIGSFECSGGDLVCPPGFYFKDSTQDCEDIDECVTGQNDCNRESQVCLNTKGNFTCIDKASKTNCPPGFKMNPATQICEDINECLENPYMCSPDEECINEPGGHNCRSTLPHARYTPVSRPVSPVSTSQTSTVTTPSTTTVTQKTTPQTTTQKTTLRTTPATTPSTTTKTTTQTTIKTTPYIPIFYPTFDPANPEPPKVFDSSTYSTSSRTPVLLTRPPTKPIPEYVKPKSSTVCSKGFRYSQQTQQCIDIDECEDDPQACDSNQDCYNTPGSYVCNCKSGFTMDPTIRACVDINECQVVGSNDCGEGQRCDNTIGSYLCSRITGCGTGYTLNYASGNCEDDDECLLGTHSCDKLGTNLICRNTHGSYRCERIHRYQPHVVIINQTRYSGQTKKCLPGYYMDSASNCQDINECESNPCTRGQRCLNLRGRYECISKFECKGGFELNEAGDGCVDINECVKGTHSCSSSQICKNHIGFHRCTCPHGHKLVNNECVDINECEFYKDRICTSNSYCLNTIGSYKCKCKEGFREYGSKCVDVDECMENPGLCHQNCVNIWGGYRCSCERGFALNSDNRTCNDIDECEKFKYKHLCIGKCENTPGSYICRCPPGYKLGSDGRTCLDIDECTLKQPCIGRDTICFNTRGGYECPSINCPQNYIRDPDHKSRCKRDPHKCNYPGSCSDIPEQYTYHFFTLISNLPMLQGPIKFFQMKGPIWDTSTAKFNLKLENVKCPSHVRQIDQSYFRVNKEPRKADISFIQPIEGPQQIELSFEMQLFTNKLYTGRVIAKIFIFVSEYSF